MAIYIDGGYFEQISRQLGVRVHFAKFVDEILNIVTDRTSGTLDLLRTYYYDSLPYQGDPATQEESERFARKRSFFQVLRRIERFQVREGRLALRGYDQSGRPMFQQKRVDLMLGLDFALLSSKRQITHAVLIAGDSDFIPAVEVAKQEGIAVWLFHGPGRTSERRSTHAEELWVAADVRFELTREFLSRSAM
ncbi:MAG: NYN domain-containing protein [Dehalococcoidia bacterium]|nr:NYN domain-containing protein [Dehalococcoidia bacterium]